MPITDVLSIFTDRNKAKLKREEQELSERRRKVALSEASLERELDRVGRMKVFNLMSSNGWPSGNPAPLWVWWGAVREVDMQNDR